MREPVLRALVVLSVLLVVAAAVTSLVLASRRIDAISALLGAALCSAVVGAILVLKCLPTRWANKVMERLAGSLQGQVDSEDLVEGWVEVVSRTMQPASVAV